ncbi:hypothetical protein CROQUDRAFT_668583 [Cronartium quercuum f. sp. fusiforme G11]|uniref:Uncharacterized protein n=1 Tax=Cronartium quercuum f. sp. fusiforme G11 TaxID=708437 RepID=A0A9P6NUE8_9BASI|nr:hypothetical protein CROQUDRAFT_668583 [Cronartium quercuum f. sp. fusiforme G11]
MNGCDFNKKYYDRLSMPYHINKCAEDMGDSIDLTAPSEGSDAEDRAANVANMYFTQGNFGDLYDQESDDGDYTPEDDEDEDEEEEDVPFDTIGDEQMHD